MDQLNALFNIIQYEFKNPEVLHQALTHRSYAFEQTGGVGDNERLEFLGDAIIGSCVCEELYHRYPDYPEGKLTILKSYLVSKKFLALLAQEINLGEFLKLGIGEDRNGGRMRSTVLGNAFEALVGAIFLDGGYRKAYEFLWSRINLKLECIEEQLAEQNYKNVLQTYAQKHFGQLPRYYIQDESGPLHERTYSVEVRVGDEVLGCGTDSSKKKAGIKAAKDALSRLNMI